MIDPDTALWALQRVHDVTLIPADKRGDLDYLRSVVMLAHGYAGAALRPPPLPLDEEAPPMAQEGRSPADAPDAQPA